MRILLVKTSSLGDVIHNLPVATDIRRALPGATIDWVVEEGFAQIPRLHPAVREAIPVAVRRWRKTPLDRTAWREIRQFRQTLRERDYDMVIDTQGLVKSALLVAGLRSPRAGFDARSAREPLAARFYDRRLAVPRGLHAVERNRRLAALALEYTLPATLDYGIAAPTAAAPRLEFAGRYVVLLTATSRDDKLWPEPRWSELAQALGVRDLGFVLPAGSAIERARAERIAAAIGPAAQVLPPSDLSTLAGVLAGAALAIGVDTGLVHLAAALGRPTIALFCASEPGLTGVLATTPVANLGARGAAPGVAAVTARAHDLLAAP